MEINLESLGITKEVITEKVIADAVEQIVEQVDNNFANKISTDVRKIVTGKIDQKVDSLIESVLSGVYQPVDTYGEPKGEVTTLRDLFKTSCENWWKTTVDSNGKVIERSHYGTKQSRAEYVAKKIFQESLSQELFKEFQSLIKSAVAKAKEDMPTVITALVKSHWNRQ